ncbi:MAG: chromosome segregation protein SMC [Acetobacteraceae bacterium]|nr:chromosome segregation protein SMC [Acetobacteraceae bacterium]
MRLAIAGFKSFAEPATVEILPGLTGIVGPNGCGKSNVTDALRWAMGEASARTMRGAEMDDVIFAGTTTRPSRNLAEVVLTLEMADGQPELSVARRIERGVGSAYRVNGRETRARDVQTLFADLASGARSSAMVSQGRVSALVNARPEERRQVLEEAAGITGLHARRTEAETRLRAAEANLGRAEERRAMLGTQLEGLQKQAKQAARYRTVSATVGEAEAMMLSIGRERARAIATEAATALAAAGAAVTAAAAEAVAAAQAARAAQAAIPDCRQAESAARTALERARVAQEGMAAEIARAEGALAAATARRAQAVRDLAHAEQIQRDSDAADARLEAEALRLADEIEAYPAALGAARARSLELAEALAAAEAAASAATEQAAALAARAASLQQTLSAAEARSRRASEAMARLQGEKARAEAAAPDPADVCRALEAEAAAMAAVTAARERADAAEAARAGALPAAAAARERLHRAEAARGTLAAELNGLSRVLSVRDGERWPKMVDRLEVPAGLEAALGAALGEELAAAADPNAARHWRELPPLDDPAPLLGESLATAVRGPALLARALAGVSVVADDRTGEAAQAGLRPGQTLVSRAGAVWRWDGYTVRAGAPTAAAVRLQQRNRLAELQAQLAEAEGLMGEARAAREAADAAERSATVADGQARAGLREAEKAAERQRTEAAALRGRAEQSGARLRDLQSQIDALAPERDDAAAALAVAQREGEAAPDVSLLRAEVDRSKAAQVAARGRDRDAQLALQALERAHAAGQTRLGVIGRERDDVRMRAADARGRVTDLAARAQQAAVEAEALRGAPAAAAAQAQQSEAALRTALAAHGEAASALAAAERHEAAAAARARTAEQALYACREALVRSEGAASAADQGVIAAEAAVNERLGALDIPPPPADVSLAAEERARAKWQRLAREREAIGPVNLRADIEAEALAAEMATIVAERDEIGSAIARLRGGIGHLNREGRERLSDVFSAVDKHFQQLFARLFGGGRAHLALVGSDDPLQAGLEIYAQPPGKKLATLSLLSGGEQALTALSLIFAVFRCNPAPLCVLDEVDAPLDDANVERFCTLLTDMVAATGTRFLVVTHHHLTMARMDRLYGVTMQERGVSRLLSVDLGAAVELVEAMAAE